jgi:hypothetical protein
VQVMNALPPTLPQRSFQAAISVPAASIGEWWIPYWPINFLFGVFIGVVRRTNPKR